MNNLKKSTGPTVTRNKQPIKTEEEEKYHKDNQTLRLQVTHQNQASIYLNDVRFL